MRIILIFVLTIILSCNNINYKLKGAYGASKNIVDAKKRQTYICSYKPIDNKIDSLNINEIFIEKGFTYGDTFEETILNSSSNARYEYQLTIKIEDGMIPIYENKYGFITDGALRNNFLRFSVYIPLVEFPTSDTINLFILNKIKYKLDTIGVVKCVKEIDSNSL